MATIISIIISIILILFSYLLSQKTKTNEEKYLEDIIQMEYLKNYSLKHCKK